MAIYIQAQFDDDLEVVRALFKEYALSLGIDLGFQDFERELAELPGEYAPPTGRVILAYQEEQLVGFVGLRKFIDGICEMKRLYVRSEYRRKGTGRGLAEAVIEEARKIGYERMRLDTLPWMVEAIELYDALGFKEIATYRYNPIEGARFFELILASFPNSFSRSGGVDAEQD